MTEKRQVANAKEMLPFVELKEIRVYEVAGRRLTEADDREIGESLSMNAHGNESVFETRAKLIVHTDEADLLADAGVIFNFAEPLEIPESVVVEFVEKVGIMALFPFLREQVYTSASRLGVAPPVVGLLRAGGFQIDTSGQSVTTSEDE